MSQDIEYLPTFYKKYVDLLTDKSVNEALITNKKMMLNTFNNIDESKGNYKYGPDKWTIKEVISHIIDAERIFTYRALRFSRNDKTELAGFDENFYVDNGNANERALSNLIIEFKNVRTSSIDLFDNFSEEILKRYGMANGEKISVKAIGYTIAGHALHHHNILKERYGA